MSSRNLMTTVLAWLQASNYRRASFERIIEKIPGITFGDLEDLVDMNPSTFRDARMKRGRQGLALVDGYVINLSNQTATADGYSVQNDIPVTQANSAPSVTEADVNDAIASEYYLNVGGALDAQEKVNWIKPTERPVSLNLLTICIIVLKNGYTVTGKSACVSPDKYDEKIGQNSARKQAVQKIWPLLGFRLADKVNGI